MPKHASRLALLVAVTGFALAGCATSASTETATETVETADCVPAHEGVATVEEGFLTVAAYEYPPFSAIDGESLSGAEEKSFTPLLNSSASRSKYSQVLLPP